MLEVPLDDSLRGGADLEVDTVADVTSSLCLLNNIDFIISSEIWKNYTDGWIGHLVPNIKSLIVRLK